MNGKIANLIRSLGEVTSTDIDDCSVDELVQLQYWLMRHQGAIFVKSVGRLSLDIQLLGKNDEN